MHPLLPLAKKVQKDGKIGCLMHLFDHLDAPSPDMHLSIYLYWYNIKLISNNRLIVLFDAAHPIIAPGGGTTDYIVDPPPLENENHPQNGPTY